MVYTKMRIYEQSKTKQRSEKGKFYNNELEK